MKPRTILAGAICSSVLFVGGCNRNDTAGSGQPDTTGSTAMSNGAGGTSGSAAENARPMSAIGCLQRGSGINTFILTQVNEPAAGIDPSGQPTGTAGRGGDAVQQEHMRAVAASYRIDPPSGVKTDEMIGKQVRVTGSLAEPSSAQSSERSSVNTGDLAEIEATAISIVGEVCGANGSETRQPSSAQSGATQERR